MNYLELVERPPGYTWKQIEGIYHFALSGASAFENKNKRNQILASRTAQWEKWKRTLPLEIAFMTPAPNYGHFANVAIDGNSILTPSAEVFYAMLLFARSEQQARFLENPMLHKQCQASFHHENAHRTTAMQYGADWTVYGITIDRNFHNGHSSGTYITPHIRLCGTLPIEGFVHMVFAPDRVSDADLADVGLTFPVYEDILTHGNDPADVVLKPWRDAGLVQPSLG